MSGAAIADAGGLGAIELKAMKEQGFDEDFSLAITGASSIWGPLFRVAYLPFYSASPAVSRSGKLFIGGIIPGILMAIAMAVLVCIQSIKRNYPRMPFPTAHSLGILLKQLSSLCCAL